MSDATAGDIGIGALGDILGFHIRLAYGAVYRRFTETFADLGMTQKQVSVLWMIGDHPGIAQTDLALHLQMDRATTMAIVNRLRDRGYIERIRSRGDARKQALFLLDEGGAALVRARAAIQAHESSLQQRFSPHEVATLIALLARIHATG